jgi:hypothetical protein
MPVDPQQLYARGLISDDAMSSFADRLAAYGAPPSENVEDRRNDPQSGYEHMLAFNNLSGAAYRHLFPWLRSLDMHLPQPKIPRQAGQLREQAGYYDISKRQTP